MDSSTPSTSFYPCPIRAADVFNPQPTPPPTYYLKDHTCVVYNESDWPTTSENDEEEANKEGQNTSNRGSSPVNASTVVRVQPLGLLSVRMREYDGKQKLSGGKYNNDHTSKEGQFASPAEQSTPAAKADIPQGPPSILKYNKLLAESNVKPCTRKLLGAANTTAHARKKPKAASKPSRQRIQVVLTHAKEGKENLPCVSSDKIDDLFQATQLAQRNSSKGQEQAQVQKQRLYDIESLPDPFILTSEDECDDPFEGGRSDTRRAVAGEPDSIKGAIAANFGPAPITTAGSVAVTSVGASKSCLAINAPPKGLAVSFKDPLMFHFCSHPGPDDIWSQHGLPVHLTLY